MKLLKSFAAASVALGLAGTTAQAQTKIYIAGAPALRTELTTAIENLFAGQGGVQRAYNGGAIITANVVEWTGGTIASQPVTVKLTYNGSAGGWKTNAASQNVRFLADSVAALGSGRTDVLTNLTATPVETAVPDFHISNEYQTSTPWSGTNQVAFPETGNTTYATLNDQIVGIMPIRIVASPAAPAGLNITPQLAQQLFGNGSLRLSQLTGNPADNGKTVYPLSRGIDSGVRTLFAAAIGLGTSTPIATYQATINPASTTGKTILGVSIVAPGTGYTVAPTIAIAGPGGGGTTATATATVANGKITAINIVNPGSGYDSTLTYTVTITPVSGGINASARAVVAGASVSSQAFWPATGITAGPSGTDNRILGVETGEGNGGYPTFGPLLTALTSTLALPGGNAGDIYITPLAGSDADSAIKGGAKEVTWNGVSLGNTTAYGNTAGADTPSLTGGTASPTLAHGSYDLWGYVRLPYRNSLNLPINATKKAVLTAISNQLLNADAPTLLKDVNIQRSSDGGPISVGQLEQ